MAELLKFIVELDRQRLDQCLTAELQQRADLGLITRSQVRNWITSGMVLVNGTAASKAGQELRSGDKVTVLSEVAAIYGDAKAEAFAFPLEVVYEDKYLLVVNKPAGLSTHPGAGNKKSTLLNALVARFGDQSFFAKVDGASPRPGIVHRLDKDTTGLLVVAKDAATHAALSRQFAERTTGRTYLALVHSTPRAKVPQQSGMLETQIGRHPRDRTKMSVVEAGGKRAVTKWQVLERMKHAALLEVVLETGRTHQIRVHMHHLGAPLVGDKLYLNEKELTPDLKKALETFGRQALHAKQLAFTHPHTGERLSFSVPLPTDMAALISAFGGQWSEPV
ncbi:MAG: RluA family pseudouridine synthase [Oligoflexia bacterium]|nr:RluA family pseudouridine synthase [Oligoflexia bacterium]